MIDRRGLLTVMAALPVVGACTQQRGAPEAGRLPDILKSKRATVGYVSLAPWAVRNAEGRLTGSFVELCQRVFGPLGVQVVFEEAQWSTFVAGIQAGRFDLSIVPSYPTIERAAAVAFTTQISSLANSALVRDSAPFRSVFDLNRKGVTIVAVEGESAVEFTRTHLPLASLRTVGSGDFPLLYSEVVAGRADAAMGYVDSIAKFVAQHQGVRDVAPGNPYSVLPICWATSYDADDLREFLNSAISYLRGNGTVDALEKQYATPAA